MNKSYELNNGGRIPAIGFGTFLIPDGETVSDAVSRAIEAGYTHVDTAAIYENEKGVGAGLRQSGADRKDIFLVSKVWNDRQEYDETLKAFDETLDRLGTDYLDLYLIHWPTAKSSECWAALEHLYEKKRVRSIGVSNFTENQLEELLASAKIVPAVNQIELHPRFPQHSLKEYCDKKGILVESWGPLIQGKIFGIPQIEALAKKHACTVAQLAIAWQLRQGNICLAKSVKPERIRENLQIPDIQFTPEDLKEIEGLSGERIGPDPEVFGF